MRITSGIRRGLRLQAPEGMDTRPTLDRIKQTMFNCIQFEIRSRVVLDLFGGSGQLGLEALSRGACFAYFNDADPNAVSVIQKNIAAARFEKMSQVSCNYYQDCVKMLSNSGNTVSLVFLDPPYGPTILTDILQLLGTSNILSPDALLVCEHDASLPQSWPMGYRVYKQRTCGSVGFTILQRT